MKIITPIVLAGAALAFCGCTTDSPIFANDATKTQAANANPSVEEQSRDMQNWQNSGQNMGVSGGTQTSPVQSNNQMNPYGH